MNDGSELLAVLNSCPSMHTWRVFTISLGQLKDMADDSTQLSFHENQHLQKFKQVRPAKTLHMLQD